MRASTKTTSVSVIISIILIGGALMISGGSNGNEPTPNGNNVTVVDGNQIIEIRAKGGYWPRKTIAKAGMPTILRFNTNGTFDCSSYVLIPSMNITKILPHTGLTDINIGNPQATTLQGVCGMGMYLFEVYFQK